MAVIAQEYDDEQIIAALTRIKPGLNFGEQKNVHDIDVEENGSHPELVITLRYPLAQRDLDNILDSAKKR